MEKKQRQGTLCVQAGYKAKNGEPIELPIIQSTTFKYDDSDEMAKLFDLEKEGYFYTRLQNPTNDAVAAKIAALEGGVGAVLTSSGQAANFYALFNICQAGDHFVTSNEIYGGTYNLFGVTMKKLGIESTFVSPTSTACPSSSTTLSPRPSTAAPLSGAQTSSPTLPRSIWMVTPRRSVVSLSTAATSTGKHMPTSSLASAHPTSRTTDLPTPKPLARWLI